MLRERWAYLGGGGGVIGGEIRYNLTNVKLTK